MDVVGVSTRYPNGAGASANDAGGVAQPKRQGGKQQATSTPSHGANKHVNFNGGGEEKKREKFLTAKYGAHQVREEAMIPVPKHTHTHLSLSPVQMALIRKRLRVEMWMYERLQEIYGAVRPHENRTKNIESLMPIQSKVVKNLR